MYATFHLITICLLASAVSASGLKTHLTNAPESLVSRKITTGQLNSFLANDSNRFSSKTIGYHNHVRFALKAIPRGGSSSAPILGGPDPGILRRLFPNFPWHCLPNWLTYIRCLAIPGLAALFFAPDLNNKHIYTGVLFAVASFTDWLDGYLARRWEITSSFGAFLDPVADKLMVSTALILLSGRYGPIVSIPTCIILAREIAVSALREWMAQRGQRDSVKVGFQGKVKTASTMVALTLLLLVPHPFIETTGQAASFTTEIVFSTLYRSGLALLFLSSFITVTSGMVYFKAATPILFDSK